MKPKNRFKRRPEHVRDKWKDQLTGDEIRTVAELERVKKEAERGIKDLMGMAWLRALAAESANG